MKIEARADGKVKETDASGDVTATYSRAVGGAAGGGLGTMMDPAGGEVLAVPGAKLGQAAGTVGGGAFGATDTGNAVINDIYDWFLQPPWEIER